MNCRKGPRRWRKRSRERNTYENTTNLAKTCSVMTSRSQFFYYYPYFSKLSHVWSKICIHILYLNSFILKSLLQDLPVPTDVQLAIPNDIFGELVHVMEFLTCFSSLFDVHEVFPEGITIGVWIDFTCWPVRLFHVKMSRRGGNWEREDTYH